MIPEMSAPAPRRRLADLVIGLVLVICLGACGVPELGSDALSEGAANETTTPRSLASTGPTAAEPADAESTIAEPTAEPTRRRLDGEPPPPPDDDLEADDLEGLGELGVLPDLVQRALSPTADCDFDDALSTCQ